MHVNSERISSLLKKCRVTARRRAIQISLLFASTRTAAACAAGRLFLRIACCNTQRASCFHRICNTRRFLWRSCGKCSFSAPAARSGRHILRVPEAKPGISIPRLLNDRPVMPRDFRISYARSPAGSRSTATVRFPSSSRFSRKRGDAAINGFCSNICTSTPACNSRRPTSVRKHPNR